MKFRVSSHASKFMKAIKVIRISPCGKHQEDDNGRKLDLHKLV